MHAFESRGYRLGPDPFLAGSMRLRPPALEHPCEEQKQFRPPDLRL